jgi:hypothetical protein
MARGGFRKDVPTPDGKFRRSQVLTTYGPGALVDLLEHSVLIKGLDDWRWAGPPKEIKEPRLQERLVSRRLLSPQGTLRAPPVGDDGEADRFHGIPARLFPRWFVCQHCRALRREDHLAWHHGVPRHECERGRTSKVVPVRFVLCCPRGHLDDLDWVGVGHPAGPCTAPSLRLDEGATGDFAEVVVRCHCGQFRPLIELKRAEQSPKCSGARPWLGRDSHETCGRPAKLTVRTASNAWFSFVETVLSIPDADDPVGEAVAREWAILQAATQHLLPGFRAIPSVQVALAGFTDAQVLAAIDARRSGQTARRPGVRVAEYQQFLAAPAETPGEQPAAGVTFFARRVAGAPPVGIGRVVLVSKLRTVSAQLGFTRLAFPSRGLDGEFDPVVEMAPLGQNQTWLPANEGFGEGLFIHLDEPTLQAWEQRPEVMSRDAVLRAAHAEYQRNFQTAGEFPGVRLHLLHSLSHLLITALSLECGYAAAALQERLYCAPATAPQPMAGILLSTTTPGTDGTLGGLIEEGRRFAAHLTRALRLGRLCSNDPVCASHPPDGRDERALHGAACHGCLFVAEPSCERFNLDLDRALVVPTLGHPAAMAYFPDPLWT